MPLSNEWKYRVEAWIEELKNHFYRELGTVEFEGFTTMEHLSLEEAASQSFAPMPDGTAWGAKWEYGWFRGKLELPEAAGGGRIILRPDTGGESLVFINGRAAGARDLQHSDITLCREGVPGKVYEIYLETYAGHGPREENCTPVPPGRVTVPEPPSAQVAVGRSSYGIWEEEAYQLWIDVSSLYHIRCNINENSLRAAEIDRGLMDFSLLVDFELPYEERIETFTAGRKRLRPLLECVNGSTAPTMFIFGHSHLDLAWMWPLAETGRKCARTLSTQLALMDEYPEYKFFLSQPPIYEMLKKRYPDIYKEVLEKVGAGRIIPDGAMWVESDTNLPGGESLIRQFLYGKRFFREELGVDSRVLWLPDVFGYTGALPQIMKSCGVDYFASQKIFNNYNGGEPFPYNNFIWEGIDGSKVLTNMFTKQNLPMDPGTLIRQWEVRRQKNSISALMIPFGYGDGGGGAIRDHLEYASRSGDLEGVPKTRMLPPSEFFRDLEGKGLPEERYAGEMYLQIHRGTYTTQAKTKKGNRKCEFSMREAEFWGSAAGILQGFSYPYGQMEELWKTLLLNQFHDILPGSSIHRVHEEAERDHRSILTASGGIAGAARDTLPDSGEGLMVFNSLSWPRRDLVELPEGFAGTEPLQEIDGRLFTEVSVPSCGWTTIGSGIPEIHGIQGMAGVPETSGRPEMVPDGQLEAGSHYLENSQMRVEFNPKGEISLIYDKAAGRKVSAGLCNSFRMYKDVTTCYDAWDIDSMYEKLPVALEEPAELEMIAAGPLLAGIRIKRKLHHSFLTQEVYLRRDSRRLDFRTVIDWQESHKLLKVAFPVALHVREAMHEIQFGHVKRPNHKSRQYDADHYEVCNHKWTALAEPERGCALLNDCKYGISVSDGCMSLTLLKSPLVPDMTADRGIQEFTYAFYFWNGPVTESGVVKEAYALNCPLSVSGGSAGEKSLFSLDRDGIILETVKPAEDRTGDVIVRMYESNGTGTAAGFRTALPIRKAFAVDMLENTLEELPLENGVLRLEFRPFEIRSLRLVF